MAQRDSAPWLVRNWWVPAGVVLGFIVGAWQAGLFDPAGPQPGQNPSGALVIGVGICWAIDRLFVRPRRLSVLPEVHPPAVSDARTEPADEREATPDAVVPAETHEHDIGGVEVAVNFCPSCGTKRVSSGPFCVTCGAAIPKPEDLSSE